MHVPPQGRESAADEQPRWQTDPDPVWLHTRREAGFVLGLWLACMVWTLGYCWRFAYRDDAAQIVGGIPVWVWGGVALPWTFAIVATFGFCRYGIADDPLEDG